ncbi:MAG: hypothetical protein NXI19_17555 [Alphaproteobacteria bacterium]|nr:hypothetical protein [Alphaproteobacteria bacterium]
MVVFVVEPTPPVAGMEAALPAIEVMAGSVAVRLSEDRKKLSQSATESVTVRAARIWERPRDRGGRLRCSGSLAINARTGGAARNTSSSGTTERMGDR